LLSYQHGFHAGGFADVHKHIALCLLLSHLQQKQTPFCVIDSHAGRGRYDLLSEQAGRTGEWQAGIGQLFNTEPKSEGLRSYLDVVSDFNKSGDLTTYPGSPAIAAKLIRRTDRLVLIEAHPAEHAALYATFRHDKRVHIHKRDGFEAMPALVPPRERRGLVLIDPSYEIKTEYKTVPKAVHSAVQRWPTGIFAIWYPLLPDERHMPLVAGLEALGSHLLVAELTGPAPERGLVGTGLAVINPPWHFGDALAAAGDEIANGLFKGVGHHAMRELEAIKGVR